MGCDIHGWVEVQHGIPGRLTWWGGAIRLNAVVGRDYDGFGCLFGVRDSTNFAPVAPRRGLPPNLSADVKIDSMGPTAAHVSSIAHADVEARLAADRYHSASWLTFAEIKAIDLDEPALAVDDRIHQYHRNEDGSLTFVGKAAWNAAFARATDIELGQIIAGDFHWEEGQTWEHGAYVFKAERMTRRQALDGWTLLFHMMELLAAQYGDDGVRMVVWFDS